MLRVLAVVVPCLAVILVVFWGDFNLATCEELSDVELMELVGFGAVKAVYRGVWRRRDVTVSVLRDGAFKRDFHHGVAMLKKYRSDPRVVRLIGHCRDTIVTEHYPAGSALGLVADTVETALRLCVEYVDILDLLHDPSRTVTVNCDSNDLNKTLSQFLVTQGKNLVLNDVDSLAEMTDGPIRCGSKPLAGSFVAPEQTGPDPYDEKTDIWKAASVCEHFLSRAANAMSARYALFALHRRCKSLDPKARPTAKELALEYRKLQSEYSANDGQ